MMLFRFIVVAPLSWFRAASTMAYVGDPRRVHVPTQAGAAVCRYSGVEDQSVRREPRRGMRILRGGSAGVVLTLLGSLLAALPAGPAQAAGATLNVPSQL